MACHLLFSKAIASLLGSGALLLTYHLQDIIFTDEGGCIVTETSEFSVKNLG